jgi:hypothetical protein
MRTRVGGFSVVVFLSLAGCKPASLSEMRPGLKGSTLQCWLTLNFKKPVPEDPRDVKVVFKSIVLNQDETYAWDYIATHDYNVVTEKGWTGAELDKFVLNESTTVDFSPTTGTAMKVEFMIPSKTEVKVTSASDVSLTAELFWGGKSVDTMSRGMFLAYETK